MTRTKHVMINKPTAVARLSAFLDASKYSPDRIYSHADYHYERNPDGSLDYRKRTEVRTPLYKSDISEVLNTIEKIAGLLNEYYEYEFTDADGLLETIETLITDVSGEDA